MIDFCQPVSEVHNFVRGLSPWPAAWTTMNGDQLKLIRTKVEFRQHGEDPGSILTDNKSYLKVACGTDGFLVVENLQLAGRRRMDTETFLRGIDIPEGTILG